MDGNKPSRANIQAILEQRRLAKQAKREAAATNTATVPLGVPSPGGSGAGVQDRRESVKDRLRAEAEARVKRKLQQRRSEHAGGTIPSDPGTAAETGSVRTTSLVQKPNMMQQDPSSFFSALTANRGESAADDKARAIKQQATEEEEAVKQKAAEEEVRQKAAEEEAKDKKAKEEAKASREEAKAAKDAAIAARRQAVRQKAADEADARMKAAKERAAREEAADEAAALQTKPVQGSVAAAAVAPSSPDALAAFGAQRAVGELTTHPDLEASSIHTKEDAQSPRQLEMRQRLNSLKAGSNSHEAEPNIDTAAAQVEQSPPSTRETEEPNDTKAKPAIRRVPTVVPILPFHKLISGDSLGVLDPSRGQAIDPSRGQTDPSRGQNEPGSSQQGRTRQQKPTADPANSAPSTGQRRRGANQTDSPSRAWAESALNKKAVSKDAHISRLNAEVRALESKLDVLKMREREQSSSPHSERTTPAKATPRPSPGHVTPSTRAEMTPRKMNYSGKVVQVDLVPSKRTPGSGTARTPGNSTARHVYVQSTHDTPKKTWQVELPAVCGAVSNELPAVCGAVSNVLLCVEPRSKVEGGLTSYCLQHTPRAKVKPSPDAFERLSTPRVHRGGASPRVVAVKPLREHMKDVRESTAAQHKVHLVEEARLSKIQESHTPRCADKEECEFEGKSDVLPQPLIDEFIQRQFKFIESRDEWIEKQQGDQVRLHEGADALSLVSESIKRYDGMVSKGKLKKGCRAEREKKQKELEDKQARIKKAIARRHRKETLLRRKQREIKLAQAKARHAAQQQQPTQMMISRPTKDPDPHSYEGRKQRWGSAIHRLSPLSASERDSADDLLDDEYGQDLDIGVNISGYRVNITDLQDNSRDSDDVPDTEDKSDELDADQYDGNNLDEASGRHRTDTLDNLLDDSPATSQSLGSLDDLLDDAPTTRDRTDTLGSLDDLLDDAPTTRGRTDTLGSLNDLLDDTPTARDRTDTLGSLDDLLDDASSSKGRDRTDTLGSLDDLLADSSSDSGSPGVHTRDSLDDLLADSSDEDEESDDLDALLASSDDIDDMLSS